jgi:hypothetical protein
LYDAKQKTIVDDLWSKIRFACLSRKTLVKLFI